jgi:hypothetical protein
MTMPRYAARRDAVEPELVTFARRIGWELWKLDKPCDWLGLRRGVWFPIEIKDPGVRNHADAFTVSQRLFLADVAARGGRVLVWYSKEDVMADSNARATA